MGKPKPQTSLGFGEEGGVTTTPKPKPPPLKLVSAAAWTLGCVSVDAAAKK